MNVREEAAQYYDFQSFTSDDVAFYQRRDWRHSDEHFNSETVLPDGERIVRWHRQPRLQSDPLVLFPELIYRRYEAAGALKDEAVLKIAMRCWYPDELEKLVWNSGFRVTGKWGGYHGETWGEGPELVIEFKGKY